MYQVGKEIKTNGNVCWYSERIIREGQLRKYLRVNWMEVEMAGRCGEGFVRDEG